MYVWMLCGLGIGVGVGDCRFSGGDVCLIECVVCVMCVGAYVCDVCVGAFLLLIVQLQLQLLYMALN